MRVRREQPHHGKRVNALTGSARLAIAEQLRTFINSGEPTDGDGIVDSRKSTDVASLICLNPQMQISRKSVGRTTNTGCTACNRGTVVNLEGRAIFPPQRTASHSGNIPFWTIPKQTARCCFTSASPCC